MLCLRWSIGVNSMLGIHTCGAFFHCCIHFSFIQLLFGLSTVLDVCFFNEIKFHLTLWQDEAIVGGT